LLGALKPVAMFVPGQVTDGPTDAVHRAEMMLGVFFGHAFQAAQPFTPGKTELIDQGM
jgi:hypothetical protein